MDLEERLQKVLANMGVASRRKAEEFILNGRVKVNGKVANLGDKCNIEKDVVLLNDKPIKTKTKKVYYLLNKPKGYISSVTDDRGRKTVVELLPNSERIYPVGRLDYDTEGLLLLTNDGEFTNFLTHPSFEIEKTYIAKVSGDLTDDKLALLRNGVTLEDGITAPAKIKVLESGEIFQVQVTIHEGRNREVRRMFEAVGCKVVALKRINFANLDLTGVKRGKYRELTDEEVKSLYDLQKNNGNRRRRSGNDSVNNCGKKRKNHAN